MDFYDLYAPVNEAKKALELIKGWNISGIALTHIYEDKEGINKYLERMDELNSQTKLDLVRCCVLDPGSPRELKDMLGETRQKVEIVEVDGGSFEINKAAVEDRRVDVLLHPEHKRKDPGIDHKTARAAAENEVVVGFVFHDLHQTYGKVRSHVLEHIRNSIDLCQKYGASFIVTSGAKDKYALRGGRELMSLPKVLGVEKGTAIDSVTNIPKKIVQKNRKKLKGKIKKGGVEEL